MAIHVAQTLQHGVFTRYLLRDSDEIAWGALPNAAYLARCHEPALLSIGAHLEPSSLFPVVPGALEYDTDTENPNVFIKHANFLAKVDVPGELDLAMTLTKIEVLVCEELRAAGGGSPHPNICQYLGVVLDGADRVIGIAYRRYDTNLSDAVTKNRVPGILESSSVKHIIDSVEAGMKYLHSFKLVHCDIRPENVFINLAEDGSVTEVVLGDFDAVKKVGHELVGKRAPSPWWPGKYVMQRDKAECDIDVKMLEKFPGWFDDCKTKLGGVGGSIGHAENC